MRPLRALPLLGVCFASLACNRPVGTPTSDPSRAFREWAASRVQGDVTVRALEGDPVPGTRCFEARGSRGGRVQGCLHPRLGVLSGPTGLQQWLRSRGFGPDTPATGAEAVLRAFDTLTARDGFTIERGWLRRFGVQTIVQVDGREGGQLTGRVLVLSQEGFPTEGAGRELSPELLPAGPGVAAFRAWLGPRTARYDQYSRMREYDGDGLECFQALPSTGNPRPGDAAMGCVREGRVLTGATGFTQVLRAHHFTPAEPAMTPRKLFTLYSMMVDVMDDAHPSPWTMGDARSEVDAATGALVVSVRAVPQDPRYTSAERVLTIDPQGQVTEGWRAAGATQLTPNPPGPMAEPPGGYNGPQQPAAAPST